MSYELNQSKKRRPKVATINNTRIYLCVDLFTIIALLRCSFPALMCAEDVIAFSNVASMADTWLLMAELLQSRANGYEFMIELIRLDLFQDFR